MKGMGTEGKVGTNKEAQDVGCCGQCGLRLRAGEPETRKGTGELTRTVTSHVER